MPPNSPPHRLSLFVDVVDHPRFVAIGDLVCVRGRWVKVTGVNDGTDPSGGFGYVSFSGDRMDDFAHLPAFPLARIPGPLIELAERVAK